MSKITRADVEYVAGLAQLRLDDAAKDCLVHEMGEIIGYMDQLSALNTDGVEPMMYALDMSNVFRQDVVEPWLTREEGLKNAPSHDGEYFIVPRILEVDEE
jgi:aspartyl-tRNA(Asn)/glutamyl-tRNA(Gln) amidotransferase subunit C